MRFMKLFVKRLPGDSGAQPYLEIITLENNDQYIENQKIFSQNYKFFVVFALFFMCLIQKTLGRHNS